MGLISPSIQAQAGDGNMSACFSQVKEETRSVNEKRCIACL